MPRRYDLLALDLDGTLLDARSEVSPRNAAAVAAARAAGLRVVICTGRGLVECRHILQRIDQRDPVVVAGGSIIADPVSSRTIHRFGVDLALVAHAVERLVAHDHPALVLKDPCEAGYDYLVVDGPSRIPLDPVTLWWFDAMNVRVRFARSLDDDEHPEHTVRVGACGRAGAMASIRADLAAACEGRACVHHFPAVVAPEHASRAGGETLHVLELFDIGATKWSAVSRLMAGWGIEPARVAAIGDEINDESMIRGAGLGVAMGNAVPIVREHAARTTLPNTQDGVAHAIDQILSGAW